LLPEPALSLFLLSVLVVMLMFGIGINVLDWEALFNRVAVALVAVV
jgi:hypothetical protein